MSWLPDHPGFLVAWVYVARVADVSLGTLRTVLLFRGRSALAALIGFFEVLIWVSAAGTVLTHLDTWYLAVAFAAGFGTGNFVGLWLEGKLAIGHQLVRVIASSNELTLGERLRTLGHHGVEVTGRGADARPVEILFIVERRRRIPELLGHIEAMDPAAVTTISDVTPHEFVPAPPTRTPWPRWFGVVKRK